MKVTQVISGGGFSHWFDGACASHRLFGGPYENNRYLGTLFQLDKDCQLPRRVVMGRMMLYENSTSFWEYVWYYLMVDSSWSPHQNGICLIILGIHLDEATEDSGTNAVMMEPGDTAVGDTLSGNSAQGSAIAGHGRLWLQFLTPFKICWLKFLAQK